MKITITVSRGGDYFGTLLFDQTVIKIGRLAGSHVRLDDESVARMHAVIEASDDEVRVIDLGGESGTAVNGSRVNKNAVLNDGDVLIIGTYQLAIAFKRGADVGPGEGLMEGVGRDDQLQLAPGETPLALLIRVARERGYLGSMAEHVNGWTVAFLLRVLEDAALASGRITNPHFVSAEEWEAYKQSGGPYAGMPRKVDIPASGDSANQANVRTMLTPHEVAQRLIKRALVEGSGLHAAALAAEAREWLKIDEMRPFTAALASAATHIASDSYEFGTPIERITALRELLKDTKDKLRRLVERVKRLRGVSDNTPGIHSIVTELVAYAERVDDTKG